MSILEVKNVSIRYMTGDFKEIGLKEYVMRRLKNNYKVTEFWANKNVSFALEKGDMLGIIGTNGAGKSTLLKVIAGIMEPTKGQVIRGGSIAALLELASGFDGDLTVRENTYLRGAMLGYTRKFMDDTYDRIIEFAELHEFEDRPFKQLSSGMKSRLAFSIASLVQPDILILDEVLSVGDGAFRKKSEAKMKEIINGGATTILVSHSIAQIRATCNKVLWLDKGQQIEFGEDVQGICDRYQQHLNELLTSQADAREKVRINVSNGKPTLSWDEIPGASYKIYMSTTNADNSYNVIGVVTTNSYVHSTAIAGMKYYYRVRPIIDGAAGKCSELATVTCPSVTPILSAALNNYGQPCLSWSAVTGAGSYEVFFSTTNMSGSYQRVASVTDNCYTHIAVVADMVYYYRVRAIVDGTPKRFSNAVKVMCNPI